MHICLLVHFEILYNGIKRLLEDSMVNYRIKDGRRRIMEKIKQLTTKEAWQSVFPLLKQLRTHLDEQQFLTLTEEMAKEGYMLFAMYEEETAVAVAGIIMRTNYYYGKHIFVYDLVTSQHHRSKGYGEKLMHFIHEYAADNNCQHVALESGLFRKDAHRFYEEKLGYEKFCYSFKKEIPH